MQDQKQDAHKPKTVVRMKDANGKFVSSGAKSKKKAVRARITGNPGSTLPVKTISKKNRKPATAVSTSPARVPSFFNEEGMRHFNFSCPEEAARMRFSRQNGESMNEYLSDVVSFWETCSNGNEERVFQESVRGVVPADIVMYMMASPMLKSTSFSASDELKMKSLKIVESITTALSRHDFFPHKLDMISMVSMSETKLTNLLSVVLCNEGAWSPADFDCEDSIESLTCEMLSLYTSGPTSEVTAYDIVMLGMWRCLVGFFKMCETGNFKDTFLCKEDAVTEAMRLCRALRPSVVAAVLKCSIEDVTARLVDLVRCTVNHTMYFLMMFVYTYIEDFIESKMLRHYHITGLKEVLSRKHDTFCMMMKMLPNVSFYKVDYIMAYGDSMDCMKTLYIYGVIDCVTLGPVVSGEVHNIFFYGIDLSEERDSCEFLLYSLQELFGDVFMMNPSFSLHGVFKPHFLGAVEVERGMQMKCSGSEDALYMFFPAQKMIKEGQLPVCTSFRVDTRLFERVEIEDSSIELSIAADSLWDNLRVRKMKTFPMVKLLSENDLCMARIVSDCLNGIVVDEKTCESLFGMCRKYTYDCSMVNQGLVDYSLMNMKGDAELGSYFKVDALSDIFENVVNLADGARVGRCVGMFSQDWIRRAFDLVQFDDHSYIQLFVEKDGTHSLDVMAVRKVEIQLSMDVEEVVECSQSSSLDLGATALLGHEGPDVEMKEPVVEPRPDAQPEAQPEAQPNAQPNPVRLVEEPKDDEIFECAETPSLSTPEERSIFLQKAALYTQLNQFDVMKEFTSMDYGMCVSASELDYWGIRNKTVYTEISLHIRDFIVCFVQVFALRKAGLKIDHEVRKTLRSFPPEKIKETFDHVKAMCVNMGNMPDRMKKLTSFYIPYFFEC